jgi:hypothetical protein
MKKEKRRYYIELKKRQIKYMFTKTCKRNKNVVIENKENVEFMKCVYDVVHNKFRRVNELYKLLHL